MLVRTATSTSEARIAGQPVPGVDAMFGSVELTGASMPFGRGEEIYGEAEPADYLYKVIKGSVRAYKVLHDGRRQICAFYLPGDIFGFEAGEEHSFSAEAIAPSTILLVKRNAVTALATKDPAI